MVLMLVVCPQLDVDDLDSIDKLEKHIRESAAVLIFLGSAKYFRSANCKREITAARDAELPLLLLHDGDPVKHGSPLQDLQDECPSEFHEFVFGAADVVRPVIPWHRVAEFQLVSMKLIAEGLLVASPAYMPFDDKPHPFLYLPGELSRCKLGLSAAVHVWVSDANDGAFSVAEELTLNCPELSLGVPPAYLQPTLADDGLTAVASVSIDSSAPEVVMLLYLNERTFTDPSLADEMRHVLAHNGKIVLAHENDPAKGACEFGHFFSVTPQDLIDQKLYGPIAVALHPGEQFRAVSMKLLAVAFGARNVGDQEAAVAQVVSLWRRVSGRKSRRRSALADEDDTAQLEMNDACSQHGDTAHSHP